MPRDAMAMRGSWPVVVDFSVHCLRRSGTVDRFVLTDILSLDNIIADNNKTM